VECSLLVSVFKANLGPRGERVTCQPLGKLTSREHFTHRKRSNGMFYWTASTNGVFKVVEEWMIIHFFEARFEERSTARILLARQSERRGGTTEGEPSLPTKHPITNHSLGGSQIAGWLVHVTKRMPPMDRRFLPSRLPLSKRSIQVCGWVWEILHESG